MILIKKIVSFIHLFSHFLRSIAIIGLIIMMFMVAADVFGRYLFDFPITGSSDLMELLMVVIVFFSMAGCAEKQGHTRVDIIYNYLSGPVQKKLDIFTSGASLVIFTLISWQLINRVWDIIQNPPGPSTDLLYIPHTPFILLAAVGSMALCLEITIQLVSLFFTGKNKSVNKTSD